MLLKVNSGEESLVLLIMNFTPVTFGTSAINTQSFVHDKSSSNSQFIIGKLNDLQKLLKFFSWFSISTFKVVNNGCAG